MQNTEDRRVSQIKSLLLSPYAILKLIGVSFVWQFTGIILGFAFNFGIFIIFIAIFFATIWLCPYWQPAYSIIYQIVGNNDISPKLEPYHFNVTWHGFISIGIRFVFLLYIFYVGIRILMQ